MAASLDAITAVIRPSPALVQRPIQDVTRDQNLRMTWRGLFYWLLAAIIAIVMYAWAGVAKPQQLSSIAAACLIAAASASVGILLGFLFGIPRSLQDTGSGVPPAKATGDLQHPRLKVNTNLEQISDWLTKILVGVGLTQFRDLGSHMWSLAASVAPPMGGSPPVALAVVVNFAIWGFFVGYLLTRLFLATAFSLADNAAEQLVKQEEAAFDLTEKGAYTTAASQYARALEQITPDTPPEQRQRIYEGLVYNLLYVPPPDGYSKAEKFALEYIADSNNPPSARILAYLAAAYGQEYAEKKIAGAVPNELKDIRGKSLAAAREALRLEPRLKSLLHTLWDPNDPTKSSKEEDDLEPFHDDPEFRALLE